jgi:hypothetical protein
MTCRDPARQLRQYLLEEEDVPPASAPLRHGIRRSEGMQQRDHARLHHTRGESPRAAPPHAYVRRPRPYPSPDGSAALSDSSLVVLMKNREGYASPRCSSVLGLLVSWNDQHSAAVGCSAPTLRSGSGAVSASASVSDPLLASASPRADGRLRRRHRRQSSGFRSRPRRRSHWSEELPHLSRHLPPICQTHTQSLPCVAPPGTHSP